MRKRNIDSLAERSKAPDSSSGGEIRVGSNPTAVSLLRNWAKDLICKCKTPPTGLEPAIFGLEVQRVIHYATGAHTNCSFSSLIALQLCSMRRLLLGNFQARLAQSVERKALNLVVVGSSPTVGDFSFRRPSSSFWTRQKGRHRRRQTRSLHRLAVRTSRCGRDNPGSNPGVDIFDRCGCKEGKESSQADLNRHRWIQSPEC